jgi:hypothetical protein
VAFPFIFESNWEGGVGTEWDSETDTAGKMDFPHYSTLTRTDVVGSVAPFRGAHCMRVVMSGTDDAILIEGDIDIADTVTRYSRFYLLVGNDVSATANDTWNIYEVQGTANAVENAVGLRITATTGAVEIGVGNTAPTVFTPISKGVWHSVELVSVIQTGGTGTATLWLDGASVAAVDTLTNTAVLRGVLGTQDTAATTTGTLLFDQFVFDDGQVYPITRRFPTDMLLTKSGHVAIGPCIVENLTLLSGNGTDCVAAIYDTDTGNTNDANKVGVELKNVTANDPVDPAGMPIRLERGCYVALSGTTPRAMVKLGWAPAYGSDGAIRTYGSKRKALPGNI